MNYSTIENKESNNIYLLEKEIRNMNSLSKEQMEYVKTLPKEKIIEFLELYNLCMERMVALFFTEEDKKR